MNAQATTIHVRRSRRQTDDLDLHLGFPRVLPALVAQTLDIIPQLRRFERLPPREQAHIQQVQLRRLFTHATTHSSFWRERLLEAAFDPVADPHRTLAMLPRLTRADVQSQFECMRARSPAMSSETIRTRRSSGSTGRPVSIESHAPSHGPIFAAVSVCEDMWHARDADLPKATIKDLPDATLPAWQRLYKVLGRRGPEHRRNMIDNSPEQLFEWLQSVSPYYLRTSASLAGRLADVGYARGERLPSIRQILTFGETVSPAPRMTVAEHLGAKVVDCYSCEELGWIALQCPRHDHYHIMSATVLLEIVDDFGEACAPGVPGNVLLTGLHSYAMPLIRYEIGDIAEWGEPCDCGITLPVIKTLWGRQRSFIKLPDGSMRLARLTGEYWRQIAPIDEYRIVQYSDGLIEAFVVLPRALTSDETMALKDMLRKVLAHPIDPIITQVPAIEWQHNWKRIDVMRLDRPRTEELA